MIVTIGDEFHYLNVLNLTKKENDTEKLIIIVDLLCTNLIVLYVRKNKVEFKKLCYFVESIIEKTRS